jgi:hypothetical protein
MSMLKSNQTMQLNGSTLLTGCSGRLCQPAPSQATRGLIELALFHARAALEAGWQLTPAEILTLVGPGAWHDNSASAGVHESVPETEDEIDEIPEFFGER